MLMALAAYGADLLLTTGSDSLTIQGQKSATNLQFAFGTNPNNNTSKAATDTSGKLTLKAV